MNEVNHYMLGSKEKFGMASFKQQVEEIAKMTGISFRPASPESILALESLGFPQRAIEFYTNYEPEDCVEGQVRIWPIDHIITENTEFTPGAHISRYGYFVFATTYCGDAYCLNSNKCDHEGNPQVVLVTHETVGEERI